MKKNKVFCMVMAGAMMSTLLFGCGNQSAEQAPSASGESPSSAETTGAEGLKVAAVFGGPITDKSWNETSYNGLCAIEEMGAEISYVENVAAADAPDAIRTFASSGYDVIYVNSSAFKDSAYEIAPEFPDVTFIINGAGEQGDNYFSLATGNCEQGYLQGLLCALATENGKVGYICGTEMTPTLDCEAGFYQAVAYVNEQMGTNVTSKCTYLGNYTDTSAGYQTAQSFIAEGYDCISTVADNASNAVLQACEEKGVLCVGNGIGQDEVAPTKLIAGIKKNCEGLYVESFKQYLDGTLAEKAPTETFGINYDVVGVDKFCEAASCFTDEEMAFIEDTIAKIKSGEITVMTMAQYEEAAA